MSPSAHPQPQLPAGHATAGHSPAGHRSDHVRGAAGRTRTVPDPDACRPPAGASAMPIRTELDQRMLGLDSALSAVADVPPHRWRRRVEVAAKELADCFHDHVLATEGPSGLYLEARTTEPRLASRVRRLLRDHVELTRALTDLVGMAHPAGPPSGPSTVSPRAAEDDSDRATMPLRAAGRTVLAALARHARLGSDLFFELHQRDLGVGD